MLRSLIRRIRTALSRREHARDNLEQETGFWREAVEALTKIRKRRKNHHAALIRATADRDRWDRNIKDLAAQRDGKPNPPLEGEIATAKERRQKAQARMEHLTERIEDDNVRIQRVKRRVRRTFLRKRYFLKRARFFAVKVRHLRDLKEQREKEQPTFQPWMANGADWRNASEASRAFIARCVVLYGLTCTSMARTFVPAGGSTSSYHLVWNGGRAGDAAGPWDKMVAAQRAEFERGKGLRGQLEMFGPDNDLNLKFGGQLSQAEGSPNEDLHDSHLHLAEEDSAVAAALGR